MSYQKALLIYNGNAGKKIQKKRLAPSSLFYLNL